MSGKSTVKVRAKRIGITSIIYFLFFIVLGYIYFTSVVYLTLRLELLKDVRWITENSFGKQFLWWSLFYEAPLIPLAFGGGIIVALILPTSQWMIGWLTICSMKLWEPLTNLLLYSLTGGYLSPPRMMGMYKNIYSSGGRLLSFSLVTIVEFFVIVLGAIIGKQLHQRMHQYFAKD